MPVLCLVHVWFGCSSQPPVPLRSVRAPVLELALVWGRLPHSPARRLLSGFPQGGEVPPWYLHGILRSLVVRFLGVPFPVVCLGDLHFSASSLRLPLLDFSVFLLGYSVFTFAVPLEAPLDCVFGLFSGRCGLLRSCEQTAAVPLGNGAYIGFCGHVVWFVLADWLLAEGGSLRCYYDVRAFLAGPCGVPDRLR